MARATLKVTSKDIAEALKATGGILLDTSKWLSEKKGVTITRSALQKRIVEDEHLKQVMDDIRREEFKRAAFY